MKHLTFVWPPLADYLKHPEVIRETAEAFIDCLSIKEYVIFSSKNNKVVKSKAFKTKTKKET